MMCPTWGRLWLRYKDIQIMNSSKKEVAFLPFNSINQFMLDEFREKVIRSVLFSNDQLSSDLQKNLNNITKRFVKVPGFRNSTKSPLQLRVKPLIDAFEKNATVVSGILQCWFSLKPDLAAQVFALLEKLNWEVLPLDADRTKIPGFLTRWPAADDFESLIQAFEEMYPGLDYDSDEVSLMIVWISGRLPVELIETEQSEDV